MVGVTGPIRTGVALAGGRYRIGEQVGQGGMATVHRAHDTALNRTVAVKSMLTELAHDEQCRVRFRREAQSVARLSHASVVAVHDTGEERFADGQVIPYLVMEFVHGDPLNMLLARSVGPGGIPGAVGLDRALELTAEVLSALIASHTAGIVHRDIKPSNVIVAEGGAVKVMDFGIARILDAPGQEGARTALTMAGSAIGTPQYMSPEQFEGRLTVDGRTDLYAVGVLLFQLVSGNVPFDGASHISIGFLHVTGEVPTLASRGIGVPAEVEAVIARALRKDPAERFPDARSMRDEVVRVRENLRGAATTLDPARLAGAPATVPDQEGAAPVPVRPAAHPVRPASAPVSPAPAPAFPAARPPAAPPPPAAPARPGYGYPPYAAGPARATPATTPSPGATKLPGSGPGSAPAALRPGGTRQPGWKLQRPLVWAYAMILPSFLSLGIGGPFLLVSALFAILGFRYSLKARTVAALEPTALSRFGLRLAAHLPLLAHLMFFGTCLHEGYLYGMG
ncbi:protein kinase [Streptomyces sp. NPDC093085]|uniref:protein kinase domain-containing protein n=1 Tax=Streptomyces sp. NPDC093085 TaxID=3155068 RepID=UPI00343CACA3